MNVKLLDDYQHLGDTVFSDSGEDFGVREIRQRLFQAGVDDISIVKDIDEIVLEAVLVNDYVDNGILKDDEQQKLANWWWHLGKIRDKTFPVDQLPDYLQAVYQETK